MGKAMVGHQRAGDGSSVEGLLGHLPPSETGWTQTGHPAASAPRSCEDPGFHSHLPCCRCFMRLAGSPKASPLCTQTAQDILGTAINTPLPAWCILGS